MKKRNEPKNINKNQSLKSLFIKTVLENNVIDPITSLSRKFMHSLGVLNTFDDFYYFKYRKLFRTTFRN